MPTVTVNQNQLFALLGKQYDIEEFRTLCFDFGIELEDQTFDQETNQYLLKIDTPANRPDLLCTEGIAVALNSFLENQITHKSTFVEPKFYVTVSEATQNIRPYIVCAVLRNIEVDSIVYKGLIDLQEKLHFNTSRKRTLVAIGAHDLDKVSTPLRYEAMLPRDINFVPLDQKKEVNGADLIEFYKTDKHINQYTHLLENHNRFPVLLDSKSRVISLPPIINSDFTKVTTSTKNILIECTATDLNKAKIVLNTISMLFSTYSKNKNEIEMVEIRNSYCGSSPRSTLKTPVDEKTIFELRVQEANSCIGIQISPEETQKHIRKMGLNPLSYENGVIKVEVPCLRSDILHERDIVEDIAISYGYNKIQKTLPKCFTIGKPLKINKISDLLRQELAYSGFTEVLPLILCSKKDNYQNFHIEEDGKAVELLNPKTEDCQIVRTHLLPGMLKTVQTNIKNPLPLKVFEISDVVNIEKGAPNNVLNKRNVCAVYCSKQSGFEIIHGLLNHIMMILNIKLCKSNETDGYYIQPSTNKLYFKKRSADIFYQGKLIGSFGIVNPAATANFGIPFVCSSLEFNLQPFE